MNCAICNKITGWDYETPHRIFLEGCLRELCHACFCNCIEVKEIYVGIEQTPKTSYYELKEPYRIKPMNFVCEHCKVNNSFYTTKTGMGLCSSCYVLYCAAFDFEDNKSMLNTEYVLTEAEKVEAKKQAEKEYNEEKFRLAVEQEKFKLKTKKKHWFPWRIKIERIN